MRLLRPVLLSLTVLSTYVSALDFADVPKEKHSYQSDVSRLRKIVINSLYSHRDIFLRELISNANDALEKLRLNSLTDRSIWDGSSPLNITIKAERDADGKTGRIIISDTGIGMTPEELTINLGTLAKSGTADFLAKAESQDSTGASGNLIGAFGVGFYSSFLVADRVHVASVTSKSTNNPNPSQYVFSSSADESDFELFPDPRGNTLGRGTEITLELKEDALEYLDQTALAQLVNKHSVFSTNFPIYLWSEKDEERPVKEDVEPPKDDEPTTSDEEEKTPTPEDGSPVDEDEVVVEDVETEKSKSDDTPATPKMEIVHIEEWVQLNPLAPIWMRDPKNVTNEEYSLFYQATFKDFSTPLAWDHFSAESESGVSFKAILYVPPKLDDQFWQQSAVATAKDVRLMVKRVFITSDLGDDTLPKWASFVKIVIDADDLPLNVSRETLQSTRFLKQVRQIIIKHLISLFTRLAEEDKDKFDEILKVYGPVLKLATVEDTKNRNKLAALTRFATNQRNQTSLDQYLENKKQGQKQIFYLAEMGKKISDLSKSVFVEKLDARGYEVLLLNEPLDEVLVQTLRKWKKIEFQDVAKAGLLFGDEDEDPEAEKESDEQIKARFQPLIDWLKVEAMDSVRNVVISKRLVSSPCAIVADVNGYTANVQRMMSASNSNQKKDFMHEFAKRQKSLEINPKSPLIEGLLRRVEMLPSEEGEKDVDAENDLREVASILIDGALVRSGFEVPDTNAFFTRVDRVLRRSLGVSETAATDTTVKPAPPVDPTLPEEGEEDVININIGDEPQDFKIGGDQIPIIEVPQKETVHDEL